MHSISQKILCGWLCVPGELVRKMYFCFLARSHEEHEEGTRRRKYKTAGMPGTGYLLIIIPPGGGGGALLPPNFLG